MMNEDIQFEHQQKELQALTQLFKEELEILGEDTERDGLLKLSLIHI